MNDWIMRDLKGHYWCLMWVVKRLVVRHDLLIATAFLQWGKHAVPWRRRRHSAAYATANLSKVPAIEHFVYLGCLYDPLRMWLRLLCGQCWDELLESHFWRWPTAFKKSIWGIVIWNVAASLRSCLVKFNERDGQRWQWNDNAWYPKASLCLWPLLDTVSRFGPLSGVDWPWNGFRIAVESFKVKTPVQSKDEHFWYNHIVYQSCSLYRRLYIGPSFIGSLLCNVWNGLVSLLLAVLRWILTLGQSTGEALPCDTCIFLADTEFLGDIRRLTIQTCLCAAEISWCFSSECCIYIYIYIYNVCFARV